MTPAGESCFPSLTQIAKETGLARHTVSRHITWAKDVGWLGVQQSKTEKGVFLRNNYHPKVPGGDTGKELGVIPEGNHGDHSTELGVIPEGDSNRSVNRSVNRSNIYVRKEKEVKGFDEWWSLYPKKVAKKACKQKWRVKGLEEKAPSLLAKLKSQIATDAQWKAGYAPNPLTYLNQERWQDEIQSQRTVVKIDRDKNPKDARPGESWDDYELRKRREAERM